jgi:outer membrane protein assembly factor BamB
MHSKLIVVAHLIASTCLLSAGNWPTWRGPKQDNISPETKFPEKWSRTENVKWRTSLPEAGNSSPIVWGDTVFVTQAVRDGKERTLMAFDRATGKVRWQRGVAYEEKDPRHKSNPHCAASPVTDGERVIASFASAGIVAYDLSGKQIWVADLGPQKHEWGQGSSPIIHGDLVIVYHGPGEISALHALDKRTGLKSWTVPLKEQHPPERFDGFAGKNEAVLGTFSTPLVINTTAREEIILPVVNRVRAFAPSTGRELWTADGMSPLVYGSPTFGEGILVVMGGFFGSVIYLKPGGEGDVTSKRIFYERRMRKHTIGSPIVKDGHIYLCVTDGFAQCYELATGKLLWEERLPAMGANGQTWASAVLAGDRLYVINQSGDTFVLRAAPKFELIATNPLGELSNSTLALSDGEIFLRTHSALYCIAETRQRADK